MPGPPCRSNSSGPAPVTQPTSPLGVVNVFLTPAMLGLRGRPQVAAEPRSQPPASAGSGRSVRRSEPPWHLNRDTLFCFAVVDVSSGVTLTDPDAGERYLSVAPPESRRRRPVGRAVRRTSQEASVEPHSVGRARRDHGPTASSTRSPSPDPSVCAAGRTSRHEPTCRRTARSAGLASPAAWRHRDGAVRQSGSGW